MKRLIISLFVLTAVSFAQTDVSGTISSNTTWDVSGSPYTITANTVIMDGFTLTIDAGVTVLFSQDVYLKALSGGTLIAQGTEADSIYFTVTNTSTVTNTEGIEFASGAVGSTVQNDTIYVSGSVFDYCVFKDFVLGENHIIELEIDTLLVTNSYFRNNIGSGYGTNFYEAENIPGTRLIINKSIFNNNSADRGGCIYGFRYLSVYNSVMKNNSAASSGGFYCLETAPTWEYGNVIFDNCIIESNSSSSGGAIYVHCNSNRNQNSVINNTIFKNNIADNGAIIYFRHSDFINSGDYSGIQISNCLISGNTANIEGVIKLGNTYKNANFDFNNNIFVNNQSASSGSAILLSQNGTLNLYGNILLDNITTSSNPVDGSLISCTPPTYANTGQFIDGSNNYFYGNGSTSEADVLLFGTSMGDSNAFLNNFSDYLLKLIDGSTETISIENNYWGTKSSTVIDGLIYDFNDDPNFNTPVADYTPFSMGPSPDVAGSPSSITNLAIKVDSLYQTTLADSISAGDTVYVDISGVDSDTLSKGLASVWVINLTSMDTVTKTLIETSETSGQYRGAVYTADNTNNVNDVIQGKDGEILKVVSVNDPSVYTHIFILEITK